MAMRNGGMLAVFMDLMKAYDTGPGKVAGLSGALGTERSTGRTVLGWSVK